MAKTFLGYRRAQGRAGVRNWIAVISVMDNSNPVTRAISQAVAGTIPVTAMFVRGQFGADGKQIVLRLFEHRDEQAEYFIGCG